MTFTEAAVQVLRLVGKPLHYKEITDVAIEKELLSHVGKSPEVTMGARLAAIVKKGLKETPLTRIKPGVFALVEWDEKLIEEGLADRTPALEKIAQHEATQKEAGDGEEPAERFEEVESAAMSVPLTAEDNEEANLGKDELARAELSAAATELFEEEDDDDEPILGGSDDDDEEEDEDASRRRRGRRRSRGRGRERERDDDDLPSYTVSDAGDLDSPAEVLSKAEGNSERGGGEAREHRTEERDRPGRERPKLDDSSGDRLADALEKSLAGFRRQGSAGLKQLAEGSGGGGGGGRGRQRGRPGDNGQSPLVMAAIRADNLRRASAGQRPRFRLLAGGTRVALTEWAVDQQVSRLESDVAELVQKHREAVQKVLVKKLAELPPRAQSELILTLLEKLGYCGFETVRRPGAHASELHLSATWEGPAGDVPVAVVVRRDGRDLGRERVTELRGSLHHYEQAALGLIVSTGQVLSGAREEAAVSGATPIHFVDGAKLAQLCIEHQLAVVPQTYTLCVPDLELFDALRSNG